MGREFFPISLVERYNEKTHVQKARRIPGTLCVQGKLFIGDKPEECEVRMSADSSEVELEIWAFREGRKCLQSYLDQPVVWNTFAAVRKLGSEFPLVWMKEHDYLAEVLTGDEAPVIQLACGWISALGIRMDETGKPTGDPVILTGLPILTALAELYLWAILGGAEQREALHKVLDFASLIPEAKLDCLHRVLQSRVLDSNNSFSLFLETSCNAELAQEMEKVNLQWFQGIRTSALYEIGNRLERELFQQNRTLGKSEFQWASFLQSLTAVGDGNVVDPHEIETLRQRINNPESGLYGKTGKALSEQIARTLKWRDCWISWIIGQSRVDMPYDQTRVIRLVDEKLDDIDAKRAGINEAVSSTYDLQQEGGNILRLSEWARRQGMKLVAGRLSRAFGNQSHLLSVSKLLADKKGLLPYVQSLHQAAEGIRDLQTQTSRLLHLVQQNKPTPFAQTIGALNQFEEALFAYQSKEFKRMLVEKDEASRRVIGRPDAALCGQVLDAVQEQIREVYRVAAEFRDQLEKTETIPAAYIILLQRLHPAETINLAHANLFREVHPGKEEDLADLIRQGGHFTYASPGLGRIPVSDDGLQDTHWIIHVDDWVEAIPLFIHERVVHRSMKIGKEEITVEVIETEVDQEAMEAFFRFHAEFWAQNLDAVMDSEHAGLARRLAVEKDAALNAAAEQYRRDNPDKTADEAALYAISNRKDLMEGIAALAALIAKTAENRIEAIAQKMEKEDISRIEAVEKVILDSIHIGELAKVWQSTSAQAITTASLQIVQTSQNGLADAAARLRDWVARPMRKVPSLHILTTESAGMTEGYVQTWIEEEMALFNVIRREKLENEVKQRMDQFRTRMLSLSRKVIGEFGMLVVVEEVMAQQRLPEAAAVMTVLTSFKPLMHETAKLAVLIELAEQNGLRPVQYENADDPAAVEEYLQNHREDLLTILIPKVAENNGKAFEKKVQEFKKQYPKEKIFKIQNRVIESEPDYAEELESLLRFEARQRVLEDWSRQYPERRLEEQVQTYIRTHTQLAKSTARKEVVARHQLHSQTMHPLNYYQAAGGNKRYNLLYTPSRVNLGEHERDSVVKWKQWVGGADRWAAQAGFDFYSLINEGGVEERPALAYAEIQKTSENALCVTHFAGSNALALLCMAVLEGDVEDMADQMNLRQDRLIPPAGEGYGGYCVPKDGLFLAFVLSLRNEVKLRQMGIPERFHPGIMAMAKAVLLRQHEFESHFAWQKWAAEKLLAYSQLKQYFDLQEDLLVFHITKIARAVENLGLPWHETADGSKLLANLAAHWGVDKMIIRAEQVNRFMVFYKAWMIYDALREAREQHPLCPADADAVIALSAEYKPVQDIRYSTGMRLFEILAQTGEHLTHSLDEEGQNLAYIMNHGFDPHTAHPVGQRAVRHILQAFHVSLDDQDTLQRLQAAFPPHQPPADIVMSSVTLSSTQDMLFYTSDTKLDETAERIKVILGDYGLTDEQIRANAIVHGGHLRRWAGIQQLPAAEQEELIAKVGGNIHALVLKMRGPGRSYERDIQGIDVLNTGIPFPELLNLLDDMPKTVALMRTGNPHSALAITDGTAGRSRRALTHFEVMLFFAACEKVGRRGVYRAVGLGKNNIERLREMMHKQRARAERLYTAVVAAAQADSEAERHHAAEAALALYRHLQEEITANDEAGKALREEEKMKRYKKWKPRDAFISQALVKISAGLPLSQLDFGTWIAGIGGVFVVNGEPESRIQERNKQWELGVSTIQKISGETSVEVQPFSAAEQKTIAAGMIRPEYVPESRRFVQQMLVESSSKAVEMAAREALERRKALKVRAERARAFNEREEGFRESFQPDAIPPFAQSWTQAQHFLQSILQDLQILYQQAPADAVWREIQSRVSRNFGSAIGHTRAALTRLVQDFMPESNADERSLKHQILDHIEILYNGREIVLENWKKLAGGYEDIGGLARLAEAVRENRAHLETIAQAVELFYATFALAQTLEFALVHPDEVDTGLFWKNVTDFFAETINDHWYEYWPWAYARGVGFKEIPTPDKFALAVKHHTWLYEYLRNLLIHRTELREWSEPDQDALLGNFSNGKEIVAIGAGAPTPVELRWRAYNQLREIAFIKSDGFPLPEVFHEFDPEIIEADRRVNVAILFPVGRTHTSRALREGPTLNRDLQQDQHPGANILITRHSDLVSVKGAQRKVLLLNDAHFYLSREEYCAALRRNKKLKKKELEKQLRLVETQGRLNDKGIRIAARFVQKGRPAPVVVGALIPFHGSPIYVNGITEQEGIPATIQSQIYTDLTYDKSIYPQIYTKESGVKLPPEIDWLSEWTENLTAAETLRRIRDGYAEKSFSGLRSFAQNHAIVLIKGAAESGARNLKVFELQDDRTRVCEAELEKAVHFVYDVSRTQNVVIQAAVLTSPELWATEALMERFTARQIMEWSTPVNRTVHPKSQIYGSLRIVASSSHPDRSYDTAFAISLMSLQVATNVGRGGTLEQLLDEFIQEKFRRQIQDGLRAEAPKVMRAMNEYVKRHGKEWEERTGKTIGVDLRGVSYGWANYLMLDYLIAPVFQRPGRLVDIEPLLDENGKRIGSQPILQDEQGRFVGEIIDWDFIHLEPNVGIGLWDRYNLREEANETLRCVREGCAFDWNRIGVSDRIVLRNYVLSGEEYLSANFGEAGIQRKTLQKAVESM